MGLLVVLIACSRDATGTRRSDYLTRPGTYPIGHSCRRARAGGMQQLPPRWRAGAVFAAGAAAAKRSKSCGPRARSGPRHRAGADRTAADRRAAPLLINTAARGSGAGAVGAPAGGGAAWWTAHDGRTHRAPVRGGAARVADRRTARRRRRRPVRGAGRTTCCLPRPKAHVHAVGRRRSRQSWARPRVPIVHRPCRRRARMGTSARVPGRHPVGAALSDQP